MNPPRTLAVMRPGRAGMRFVGLATVDDVMTYRVAWNQYVLDTVRCAQSCATAYTALAANQTDATLKSDLTDTATLTNGSATDLLNAWNAWANTSADVVLVSSAQILQDFQQVVLSASRLRQQITTGKLTCALEYPGPNGAVSAVAGPDRSTQAQIVAHLEALNLIASGTLRILAEGAGQVLVDTGTAAQTLGRQGLNLTGFLTSPWTLGITGIILVGGVALAILNADKIAKVVRLP